MGEGPVLGTALKLHIVHMFIAEDERAFVNGPLGSSNALLVNGVTSGLKYFSTNIQVTNFVYKSRSFIINN